MLVYWTLVLIPAIMALAERNSNAQAEKKLFLLASMSIVFVVMAFRTVGGDFYIYNLMFEEVLYGQPLIVYLVATDPGYGFLNWVSSQLGWHIYGVNAFCALIFLYCLYRVMIQERLPILFFAISMTYFIIVVGIGYTRQGVAISLIMLAISYLRNDRILWFILTVLLAGAFHSTALIAFPLLLASKRKFGSRGFSSVVKILMVVIGAYTLTVAMSGQYGLYYKHYVESDHYESGGAFLRSLVSAVAGMMFLVYRVKWGKQYGDTLLWMPFALISVLFVPMSLVASTAVDRLGLYLLPFQLITFARMPTFQSSGNNLMMFKLLIIFGYIFYFYIWLHHGTYAQELWTPYTWALCC